MSNSFATPRTTASQEIHGISQARILKSCFHFFIQGFSQPRDWTHVSHTAGRFFTTEPLGKPQFSSVHSHSCVRLFVTTWIAARQASLSVTNSQSSPKLMCIESVMPSSHLILCCPFLLLPPIPPSISLFQWVNSSHEVAKVLGVSALTSVLPKNTQDWSPLGWTACTSLQPKGLSRVFSNTTVQKYQFFSTQLSSQSNSHIHTWPLDKP